MAEVYLSLGSNVRRYHHICTALDTLTENFGELQISTVYESESVGFSGHHFLNLVVGLHTTLTVGELSSRLKRIEDLNGRDRTGPKFGPRTLDIDVLTYDQYVGVFDGVQLPRDEIPKNAFVLLPLMELAPTQLHPETQLSFEVMWKHYPNHQKLWPVLFEWQGRVISKP